MSFQEARSRNDFRVAVICAMKLEADMVTRVFDFRYNDHGKSFGKAKGDRNVYTTGIIGSHNVVLIHMPDTGKIKATAAATEARISFRNIQIAFVVGICGISPTHPETKEDIILGDCIISRTIIQYDYGRRHSGNFTTKLALSGFSNPYIPSLLAMLQTAEDRQSLTEELMGFLQEMHEKSSLEDLYPGPGRDKLYQSGYRHAHPAGFGKCPQCISGTDKCLLECEAMGCSSDRLIKRDRLASFTGILGSPKVHFGNMGSGDSVIESSSERDRIAHEYSLIAFEMEGAGVWHSFPTVVIKSASDYADSHKNKGWQYYAAAVSAAGLKAFLQKWTTTEKSMSQAESNRWSTISSDADDVLSVISYPPTTTCEMDAATIMSDRRYQEAFPMLFQRMIGTGWRNSVALEDHEFNRASITYQSSEHPAEGNNADGNETDQLSPISESVARLVVPSIDLLRLSIDVGPDFSLSMAAINIESIKPKFRDLAKHEPFIPRYADASNDPNSANTPKLNRHPSNGALRDLYLSDESKDEIDRLLLDYTALTTEVTEQLIKQAKIPEVKPSPNRQDILYPANILILIISEMLDTGLMEELKRLFSSIVMTIQEKVFANDDQLMLCGFWLTNVHEILSFFYREKQVYHQQMISDSKYGSLVEIAIEDIQTLEFNIYFTMIKAVKKRLHSMIVPIVIELQDLPSSGFRVIITPPDHVEEAPALSINNLLDLFDNIFEAIQACDLEGSSMYQIFVEVLRYVGVIAFNDLLRRKIFSYERARQISYNIIRIEEWYQAHSMADIIVTLKELSLAVDVLQSRTAKSTKWKSIPITDEVTYEIPHLREVNALDTSPPDWLQAPSLKRLVEIISAQILAEEQRKDIDFEDNDKTQEELG